MDLQQARDERLAAEAAGDHAAWTRARVREVALQEAHHYWDPAKHPRNREGEFTRVLHALAVGETARLPGKVTVTREPSVMRFPVDVRRYRIRGGAREGRSLIGTPISAIDALERYDRARRFLGRGAADVPKAPDAAPEKVGDVLRRAVGLRVRRPSNAEGVEKADALNPVPVGDINATVQTTLTNNPSVAANPMYGASERLADKVLAGEHHEKAHAAAEKAHGVVQKAADHAAERAGHAHKGDALDLDTMETGLRIVAKAAEALPKGGESFLHAVLSHGPQTVEHVAHWASHLLQARIEVERASGSGAIVRARAREERLLEIVETALLEAAGPDFEHLHPRDRRGEFRHKLGSEMRKALRSTTRHRDWKSQKVEPAYDMLTILNQYLARLHEQEPRATAQRRVIVSSPKYTPEAIHARVMKSVGRPEDAHGITGEAHFRRLVTGDLSALKGSERDMALVARRKVARFSKMSDPEIKAWSSRIDPWMFHNDLHAAHFVMDQRSAEAKARGMADLGTPEIKVGATPYTSSEHPPRTYAEALALHDDKHWRGEMVRFKAFASAAARQRGVEITDFTPTVGVYKGQWEPSYSIVAHGDPVHVHEFNRALGEHFHQESVISFRPGKGHDREVRMRGGRDPDRFYRDLVAAFGDETGATFHGGEWTVFVGSWEHEKTQTIVDLARKRGMTARVRRGTGDYIETGGR